MAPPILPVVSKTNMMSTRALVGGASVTVTVLRIVTESPTPRLALKLVGEMESAKAPEARIPKAPTANVPARLMAGRTEIKFM